LNGKVSGSVSQFVCTAFVVRRVPAPWPRRSWWPCATAFPTATSRNCRQNGPGSWHAPE